MNASFHRYMNGLARPQSTWEPWNETHQDGEYQDYGQWREIHPDWEHLCRVGS
jgi:hypothetical protein